jgi:hypothetical protein
MSSESAVTLLSDVDALRRKTRSDRSGYWLPMLLMGLLILAAPLVYRTRVFPPPSISGFMVIQGGSTPELHIPGTNFYFAPLRLFGPLGIEVDNPTAVAIYWLCVVVVGVVATVAWYRWRGQRVGVEVPIRKFVLVGVAGLLYLLGILPLITGLAVYQYLGYYTSQNFWVGAAVFVLAAGMAIFALRAPRSGKRPIWRVVVAVISIVVALLAATDVLLFATIQGYAPVLVIALALLALAAIERSLGCTVVAVLFLSTALFTNLYDVENLAYYIHRPYGGNAQLLVLYHVLLPALVLIVGGIVGAIVARKSSR